MKMFGYLPFTYANTKYLPFTYANTKYFILHLNSEHTVFPRVEGLIKL